ncbi:hypothetical protein D3C80_1090820 [compost metagenome]
MLAETFVQTEAEYFREPVVEPGNNGEHSARNQNVVEMRYQEHCIMVLVIGTGHRQHDAGNTADGKDRNKGQRVQHRCSKGYPALTQGEQPVEYFDPCRYSNRHRGDGEEAVDHYALTHGVEMVSPYQEGQERDDNHTEYHGGISVQVLFGEGGNDLTVYTEGRQNNNVYLRMSPYPEQVGPEHIHPAVGHRKEL